jgi:hypothetical protein
MSSLIVWVWMGNFYRMLYPGTLSYAYLNNSLSFVSKASSNYSTRLSFLRSWPDTCLFSASIKISNTVIGPFCELIAGTFGVLVCNMFVLPHFVLLNFLNHFQNILLLFVVVPVHCSASSLLIQGVIFVCLKFTQYIGNPCELIFFFWNRRTKKVDAFTSRLIDIHSKMLEINKSEVSLFQLGIYMYHVC